MIALDAGREGFREHVLDRAFQGKLCACLVVGEVVLAVECEPGLAANVPARLVIMPSQGGRPVHDPAMEREIGKLIFSIVTEWNVDRWSRRQVRIAAQVPTDDGGRDGIADD